MNTRCPEVLGNMSLDQLMRGHQEGGRNRGRNREVGEREGFGHQEPRSPRRGANSLLPSESYDLELRQ